MRNSAPSPDLRIVPTSSLHPHEEHDNQRAAPLIERLRAEAFMINPPIVAPMDNTGEYVILDGANRYYAFSYLEYPHILVQVAAYDSGYVELGTWRHIVSDWSVEEFIQHLREVPDIQIREEQNTKAVAHVLLKDGKTLAVLAANDTTRDRNTALRRVVAVYQRNAKLYRTALNDTEHIWPLYPNAIALMVFPRYTPEDIIAAAQPDSFLPPGISRHIVHGRALRVNYPIAELKNEQVNLEQKNEILQNWMQKKLANRQVRYYAEATYQFDE